MLKGWVMSGFPVETGVMSFCDAEGAKEFKAFSDKWQSENPEKVKFCVTAPHKPDHTRGQRHITAS